MAENSGIAWTTHTFNPWIGCTKVGPGCDNCYAEAWDARFGSGTAPHWGINGPRRKTAVQNWNKVRRWQRDRRAALDRGEKPPTVRVFCASLADVFDNHPSILPEWREELWALIEACPDLDWILVTKRIGNARKFGPKEGFPANVIILATIVNQQEAARDIYSLRAIREKGIAKHVGVSYEPALGPVDWHPLMNSSNGIDWLIVGGESQQSGPARPFEIAWAYDAIITATMYGVAVFVKQMGSNQVYSFGRKVRFNDRAGADPNEWHESLNVREFPALS